MLGPGNEEILSKGRGNPITRPAQDAWAGGAPHGGPGQGVCAGAQTFMTDTARTFR